MPWEGKRLREVMPTIRLCAGERFKKRKIKVNGQELEDLSDQVLNKEDRVSFDEENNGPHRPSA
jgi:hypothetical protein